MNAELQILSPREREVAGNLALGKTRKRLSEDLFISEHTAVTHTKNIYGKTGSNNLADVTRKTIARALHIPEDEIEQAIHLYITQTTRIVCMLFLLGLQGFLIWNDLDDELRRAKRVKTPQAKVKVMRKGRKEQ